MVNHNGSGVTFHIYAVNHFAQVYPDKVFSDWVKRIADKDILHARAREGPPPSLSQDPLRNK
eukprot:10781462-Ditylum_brightwellii.AAC.1